MQEIPNQQKGTIRDRESRNVHLKERGQKDNKEGHGATRR